LFINDQQSGAEYNSTVSGVGRRVKIDWSGTPELTSIQTMDLERQTYDNRSILDRVTDAVTTLASSPGFIVTHVLWFVA
jgi:uncharacterized membrane protein